jgi:hypothetical protein
MNVFHYSSFRNIIIAVILGIPFALPAQETTPAMPINPETKLITYQEVIKVDGLQKDLFNRAIEWINSKYKNPSDVTKVRNPENGLIEIFHRFDLHRIDEKGNKIDACIVVYTLRLEMKDGRYRYRLSDMSLKQSSRYPIERWLDKSDKAYNPNYNLYLSQVDTYAKVLIESLKNGMQPGIQKKEDLW